MFYRRVTYRIRPGQYEALTAFFVEHGLFARSRQGARLAGRWVTEGKDEVVELWEYPSREAYEIVERAVRGDELCQQAEAKKGELGDLFVEAGEDFLYDTGDYREPLYPVSATVYATNDAGGVLLVRNAHRPDTWEMPGGRLGDGETLDEAAVREVAEETGAEVALTGLVGVDHNATHGVVSVCFSAVVEGGEVGARPPETLEVRFVRPGEREISRLVTRPHFRRRVLRAAKAVGSGSASYNAFRLGPYGRTAKLGPDAG